MVAKTLSFDLILSLVMRIIIISLKFSFVMPFKSTVLMNYHGCFQYLQVCISLFNHLSHQIYFDQMFLLTKCCCYYNVVDKYAIIANTIVDKIFEIKIEQKFVRDFPHPLSQCCKDKKLGSVAATFLGNLSPDFHKIARKWGKRWHKLWDKYQILIFSPPPSLYPMLRWAFDNRV